MLTINPSTLSNKTIETDWPQNLSGDRLVDKEYANRAAANNAALTANIKLNLFHNLSPSLQYHHLYDIIRHEYWRVKPQGLFYSTACHPL